MKIIADKDIYQVEEYFSGLGEIELTPGREITANHLRDADALLVRTITNIGSEILQNTRLRFIGSASSGIDHVDTKFLTGKDIFFCHAPGCNANAVVDYFFAALAWLDISESTHWQDKSVGIIGAGNVGGNLASKLLTLGIKVSIYDPFLESNHELGAHLSTLEEVMQQEVVTIHTPLTYSGKHPTYHILDENLLLSMKNGAILINAARGEVVDNSVLEKVLELRPDLLVALDVWEGEPDINVTLMDKVKIATPHIAGYSINGKLNATKKLYSDFCRYFSLDESRAGIKANKAAIEFDCLSGEKGLVNKLILMGYPINQDFIAINTLANGSEIASDFDARRNNYSFRKEFKDFELKIKNMPDLQAETLKTLGFSIL